MPSVAGVAGLIPGQGAMIPGASRPKNQNIKQKQNCNKFNKDFKTGPHQQRNLKKEKGWSLHHWNQFKRSDLARGFIELISCL